jgi:Spy/CpxP family protein refolding chaperone
MKTISQAMLVSALVAGAMMAQPPSGPPNPATMVQHRIQRLTTLLSLTPDQVTQATTIFTNAETAVTPIQTTLRTNRTALEAAVKANQAGTIDTLAGQIGAAEGQVLDIQSKAEAAFYAILTTDQQTKLDSMPGMFGGRGPGFGGPMRRMRQ